MLNYLSYLSYAHLSVVYERSICLTVVVKPVVVLLLMAVLTVELVRLVAVERLVLVQVVLVLR